MAELNKNIEKIEAGSTLETLYNRLLDGMTNASSEQLPDFTGTDYVTTDDDGTTTVNTDKINSEIASYQDILRKNAAYLWADSIVSSLGVGSSGGINGSVSIEGDSMSGTLNALYGFAAGDNGQKFFEVYQKKTDKDGNLQNVVNIDGALYLPGDGLYLKGYNVIDYDGGTLTLSADDILLTGDVSCDGTIEIGNLTLTSDGIYVSGNVFYHSGNANNDSVNWTMKNGIVNGTLSVKGVGSFSDVLQANNGVEFGYDNTNILSISDKESVKLAGDFDILSGGIKMDESYVLYKKNNKVISIAASDKILNIGDDDTTQINLQTALCDNDGDYTLIGKYGDAYFPNSFKAGHSLSDVLIETYKRTENADGVKDAGVVFSRYLRFNSSKGIGLFSDDGLTLSIEGPFQYNKSTGSDIEQVSEIRTTNIAYKESESLYAPTNKVASSLSFETDADFYVFDKPLEGKKSLGISNSKTRLLDSELFFDDTTYLRAIDDGIKHYGNAYFTSSISSVSFSSGFAGSGWKIQTNELTGNVAATFDELTVRKKMRIYELEVQKQSVTNGSLWVSDACSGDLVEEVK